MSEVVPLPSFGEVFFDARGQERVLRVTWHEGTLVLSLWRGEMCTASFRMPFQDVERLLDTLEVGFAEAGGQLPEEMEHAEQPPQPQPEGDYPQPQGDYPEYPGTGQYVRPPQQGAPGAHQQPGGYPDAGPYPDQPAYQDAGPYPGGGPYPEQGPYQEGGPYPDNRPYPEAAHYDGGPYPESDPRLSAVPTVGPNDVLVARGTPPASDKLVASGPVPPPPPPYGQQGDQYGQPEYPPFPGPPGQHGQHNQHGPHGHHGQHGQHGQPDPYGGPPGQPGQHGQHGQPGGPHGQPGQPPMESTDPYGMAPLDQPGGYGKQPPAVDPSDPLGLGQVSNRQGRQPGPDYQPSDYQPAPGYHSPPDYQQAPGPYQQQVDPLAPGPYLPETMYSTGERLRRPEEQQHPQPGDHDPREPRRDW